MSSSAQEPDDDLECISDTASDDRSCDVSDGIVDICWDDDNYATCVNGSWLVRACASGTTCQTFNDAAVCA